MNALCFSTDMTSAEWAAWVQAVGSILAIGAGFMLANKQHRSAISLQAAARRDAQLEAARTLAILVGNCSNVMELLSEQAKTREAVHDIVENQLYFDIEELIRNDTAIAAIPLHSLPSALVTPTMILGSTVRQFRRKVEQVFRVHRSMDAAAFKDFFQSIAEMKQSIKATYDDVIAHIESLANEPGA